MANPYSWIVRPSKFETFTNLGFCSTICGTVTRFQHLFYVSWSCSTVLELFDIFWSLFQKSWYCSTLHLSSWIMPIIYHITIPKKWLNIIIDTTLIDVLVDTRWQLGIRKYSQLLSQPVHKCDSRIYHIFLQIYANFQFSNLISSREDFALYVVSLL